jgi:hypothetical protein
VLNVYENIEFPLLLGRTEREDRVDRFPHPGSRAGGVEKSPAPRVVRRPASARGHRPGTGDQAADRPGR